MITMYIANFQVSFDFKILKYKENENKLKNFYIISIKFSHIVGRGLRNNEIILNFK